MWIILGYVFANICLFSTGPNVLCLYTVSYLQLSYDDVYGLFVLYMPI